MTEAGPGPYDASRTPLDAAAVRAAVVRPGGLWRTVEVTAVTGSTNADLLARAAAGEPEGAVLAAEHQSAGRGRLGRACWTRAGRRWTRRRCGPPSSGPAACGAPSR